MNDTPTETPTAPAPVAERPVPIALRPPAERHAHVAQRMFERAQVVCGPDDVAKIEAKIKFVRGKLGQGQPVAPILPQKIGDDKERQVQYWRVLLAGQPHTFAWSNIAKGLVSFVGHGELPNGISK